MQSINKYCPRSGKPIESDSLTQYRGFTVGFCNTGCRDDFAENIEDRVRDRRHSFPPPRQSARARAQAEAVVKLASLEIEISLEDL